MGAGHIVLDDKLTYLVTGAESGGSTSSYYVEKFIVFFAHAHVPDFGIGFPGCTDKLVGYDLRFFFTIKPKCRFSDISGRITAVSIGAPWRNYSFRILGETPSRLET